jgi:hypothetical protein
MTPNSTLPDCQPITNFLAKAATRRWIPSSKHCACSRLSEHWDVDPHERTVTLLSHGGNDPAKRSVLVAETMDNARTEGFKVLRLEE